jgi:hypothetical protein
LNNNTQHNYIDFLSMLVPVKFFVASSGLKTLEKHYRNNSDFYKDFFDFNLGSNASKIIDPNKKINFSNLPKEAEKVLQQAKEQFKHRSTEQIFDELGIMQTKINKFSPLEAKWVFEYQKKFCTFEYSVDNQITLEELLQPLTMQEFQDYLKIF